MMKQQLDYAALEPLTCISSSVFSDLKRGTGFEDKHSSEKPFKLLFVDVSFVCWTWP